ncbi:hypothetical protein ASE49_15470 [Novosphingobium sp. Leaf2]|nr:hypothetical protein ASE49_15470 [Novosphingobium sp. Leaf2]
MAGKRAIVWGATGGVGDALVAALVKTGHYDVVHAGSRAGRATGGGIVRPFAFDLLDEASIGAATGRIGEDGPVHLSIVATGVLQTDRHKPEKSFAALSQEAMLDLFRINTIGPALIAKHSVALMPRDERSVFAALSARVGSITDNRLGGWHSYRASKAALNMIIANLGIELQRTRPQAIAVGLHPGTVDTTLSRPFQKNVPLAKLQSPAQSAAHLVAVMDGLTRADSGHVIAWDGERIPG